MEHTVEWLFASHCGAVLLGKKPAALFTVKPDEDAFFSVRRLAADNHLAAMPLAQNARHILVLVYDGQLLRQALCHPLAAKVLARQGYPAGGAGKLAEMLAHLKERLAVADGFPHEIGFFLGYPPADVVGFMLYGGRRCKHCGMWKVYSNVEKAKRLCCEYEECQRICCRHVEMGGSLQGLKSVAIAG